METILIGGAGDSEYWNGDNKLSCLLEFHKVDLKEGGKVEKNCYPGLRTWVRIGDMFLAKSKLWVLGCYPKADEVDECASFFDLDSDSDTNTKEWEHLPLPAKLMTLGTLGSEIYGHAHLDREDENLGRDWFKFIKNPVPYEKKNRWIRGRLVPDPQNNRILFNMLPDGNIYAYYPNPPTDGDGKEGEVRLVGRGAVYWSHVVAVARNIVFVHHHNPDSLVDNYKLLRAYDLSTSDLKDLECVWTSTRFDDGVDIMDFAGNFDALFHVPDTDNFWLAASIPVSGTDNLRLHFVKFQASRDNDDDGRIFCTPLAHVSSLLENTSSVWDLLLIHSSSLNT